MTKKFPIDGRLAVWDRVRGLTWYNSTFELLNSLTQYENMGCTSGGKLTLRDGDGEYNWHIVDNARYGEDFWLYLNISGEIEADTEWDFEADCIGKWTAPERVLKGSNVTIGGYWQ